MSELKGWVEEDKEQDLIVETAKVAARVVDNLLA